MHHLAMAIVNDRRATEAARARLFATTPQLLARAVAQHRELRLLERMGGWRGLERLVRVDLSRGLDGANADDLAQRLEWFQPPEEEEKNKKNKKKETRLTDAEIAARPRWRVALGVLRHDAPTATLWMVAVAAFASVATNAFLDESASGDLTEGVCVLLLAAVMTSVRVATEWQRQRQVRELLAVTATVNETEEEGDLSSSVEVLRCGEPTRIPRDALCVGDLLVLSAGDVAAADGMFVTSSLYMGVRVSETAMAGSSWTSYRVPGDVVVAGTKVVAGHALLLVLCVGQFTMERQLCALADPVKRTEQENCEAFVDNLYSQASATVGVTEKDGEAGYVQVPATPRTSGRGAPRGWWRRPDKTTTKETKTDEPTHSGRRLEKGAQSRFHAQVLRVQRVLAIAGYVAALVLLLVTAAMHVRGHDDDDHHVDQEGPPAVISTNGSSSFHSMAEEMRTIEQQSQRTQQMWANLFVMAMSVVLVTSTEGAVLVITVAMSAAVRSLRVHNIMFRDMIAAESPGSMTVLCVEKNGILTTNEVAVVQVVVAVAESEFVDVALPSLDVHHLITFHQLAKSIVLIARHAADDAVDRALLNFVRDRGGDEEQIRQSDMGTLTRVLPVCDARQWTAVAVFEEAQLARIVAMGDAEKLLARCATIRSVDGTVAPLSSAQRDALGRQMTCQREAGCRLVCIAYREMTGSPVSMAQWRDVEVVAPLDDKMTLLAWVALEDVVRPEAALAVKRIQDAGVAVCVVTRDHLAPAMRVARQCGIVTDRSPTEDGCSAMDAAAFRAQVIDYRGLVKPAAFEQLRSELCVLARACSADKYVLVKALQLSGHRVGTLGRGDGDMLALSASDVSFTMGRQTNRLCFDASKIVLLDDNLTSIATAIAWGRIVRARLVEFTQLQIATVAVAVVLLIIGSITEHVAPLVVEQLLWAHMLLVFFILVGQGSSRSVLDLHHGDTTLSPRLGNAPRLLDSRAIMRIVGQVVYQLLVLLLLLHFGSTILIPRDEPAAVKQPRSLQGNGIAHGSQPSIAISPSSKAAVSSVLHGLGQGAKTTHVSVARTLVFNAFVWMHLFGQVAFHGSACLRQDNTSRRFYVGWTFLAVLQVVVVQVLGEWSSCEPLSGIQWTVCIALGAGALLVDCLLRAIDRKLQPTNVESQGRKPPLQTMADCT